MKAQANARGEITEDLSGGRYRVKLEDGREVIAYVAGKMKHNKVRVGLADRVELVLDPYGGAATNRIVYRL